MSLIGHRIFYAILYYVMKFEKRRSACGFESSFCIFLFYLINVDVRKWTKADLLIYIT